MRALAWPAILIGACAILLVSCSSNPTPRVHSTKRDNPAPPVSVTHSPHTARPATTTTTTTAPAATWSRAVSLARSPLNGVSCATSTFCVAVDDSGNAFTFDGQSWGPQTSINSGAPLHAVSCPTSTFCVAVGEINTPSQTGYPSGVAYSYDGSQWTRIAGVRSDQPLESASCTSADFCMVANEDVVWELKDGSWNDLTDNAGDLIDQLSCPSDNMCIGVNGVDGDQGNAFEFNGLTWGSRGQVIDESGGMESVSCPSAAFCAAVGDGNAIATRTSGSWSGRDSVIGNEDLVTVSCSSEKSCIALGSGGSAELYDGTSWRGEIVAAGTAFTGISCTTSSFCIAIDDKGDYHVYGAAATLTPPTPTTSAAGQVRWSAPVHLGNVATTDITCPSTSYCLAVGDGGVVYAWDGHSWSGAIDDRSDFVAVSCSSAAYCVATTWSDLIVFTDGHPRQGPRNLPVEAGGISCGVDDYCVIPADNAWDDNVVYTKGSRARQPWSSESLSPPVACVSGHFCLATDDNGVTAFNGKKWRHVGGNQRTFTQIACPARSQDWCMLTDDSGDVLTYSSGDLSTATNIAGSHEIDALSCSSDAFCEAIDGAGESYTYAQGTWTDTGPVGVAGGSQIVGVSCPETNDCIAVDGDARAYALKGTS